jgi:hypothetical protein
MNYSLNLGAFEAPIATSLRTEEVQQVVQLMTGDRLSGESIRDVAAQGALEIPYPLGVIAIFPSTQQKVKKRWRWDVWIKPVSVLPAA